MEKMTKEDLMREIYIMDPSFKRLNIDLNKYTEEQLLITYTRKKNAPIAHNKDGSRGWYQSIRTDVRERVRQVPEVVRAEDIEPVKETISLTGFDALKKGDK